MGTMGKARQMADSPRREVVDSGLSTLLGGWSGGTFISTYLKIADFCRLSRVLSDFFQRTPPKTAWPAFIQNTSTPARPASSSQRS
jgi:hypothetical protein